MIRNVQKHSWEERQTLSGVWNDRNKVIGDDRQVMAVDAELLHSFCTCIDQA